MEKENPDTVFVTTPPHTHLPIIRELVGASRPGIFCEKPLANTHEAAVRAVELTRGETTAVGYQKRYSPVFKRGKEILNRNALGKLRFIHGTYYVSDVHKLSNGWRHRRGTGGVLLDFAPHLVDILLWYFRYPKVEGAIGRSFYSEADDYMLCLFGFEDGVPGSMEVSWSARGYRTPEITIEVEGELGNMKVTDGYIRTDLDREVKGLAPSGKSVSYYPSLKASPKYLLGEPEYSFEDQEFVRCASSHVEFEPNFQTASEVNRLIDDVKRKSSQGGS